MKSIKQKIIEFFLFICGNLSSLIIFLIVIFLFKEAFGIFNSPKIEKGYILCINKSNKIESLTSYQIKQIFDGEVSNWKELNGKNQEIKIFRFDEIFSIYPELEQENNFNQIPQKINQIVKENENIIAYLPENYIPEKSEYLQKLKDNNISISDFITLKEWFPTTTPAPLFGFLPLILGTLWVSFLAILIAIPLGLSVAIYLSELANESTRKILKPTIELLAGIPSVVYGFFGLVVLVPLVQKIFNLPVGETAFTGGLILAIMALPTIITLTEDAIKNTPDSLKQASLALGATKWQTIYKIIIPYSYSGIISAIILGTGRAIGETMAVVMVTGNAAVIPSSMFDSVRTIPTTIAAELGEAPNGGTHYQALFMLGVILFIITLTTSIIAEIFSKKQINKGF